MKRKTRREQVVRNNPEIRKESGSHKKSLRELYPRKWKKEMGNPVVKNWSALGDKPLSCKAHPIRRIEVRVSSNQS